jgi:hypothetical protein
MREKLETRNDRFFGQIIPLKNPSDIQYKNA